MNTSRASASVVETTTPPSETGVAPSGLPLSPPGTHQPFGTVVRLLATELRVMVREPMVLINLIGFPVVLMLVIAGVFGTTPDPDFGGVAPDEYYVASYTAVVLASLGLVTLPVHIATNRELGVTRRYRASGISAGTLVATQLLLGVVLGVVSMALVLTAGHLVYGISAPNHLGGVALWLAAGLACFIAIGSALGLLAPSGRAASAIGNLLFLPAFLLGGGGPPRDVMTDAMRGVADIIPLSHITGGLRQEWLGATDAAVVAWWPPAVAIIALAVALRIAQRRIA